MTFKTASILALALCSGLIGACQTTKLKDGDPRQVGPPEAIDPAKAQPYDPHLLDKGPPDPLGAFLADLDKSIRAWTNLTLTAATPADRNKARGVQEALRRSVRERQKDLVDALETGPPRNRVIAAGALGFSDSKDVQGPLLVALKDQNTEVVQNAALSLALLQNAETPLEPLVEVFQGSSNPQARANAAYAIRNLLEAGAAPTEDVIKAARRSLVDSEPFAQAQGALILALAKDGESVPDLAELLHANSALVIGAATQALVALGRGDPKLLGPTARALVVGLGTCPDEQRPYLLRNLVLLSGHNYADDVKAWTEWSQRLP
ncbi:MAG TPA: HEAT repeat domain-containing protein [Planctomycetota bacterium]|nr:HEAT repeat domain-containing protein [Planctomycetota bacterium]